MPVDKEVLIQYCEMKEEIKDIRRRIQKLDRFLEEPHQVSDTVKGTRRDGTIGSIKVTGYPVPEHYRKQRLRERYRLLLERKEAELLELTCQAEEYIQGIPKSEVRTMFRLYYIDGLPWWKVAQAMNRMFPKRRVKFTEDSCRVRLAGIATAAQGTAEYVSMAYWRIGYPDAGYLDAGTHCCEVEQSGSSPGP